MQVDLANYLKRYWLVLVLSGIIAAVVALAVTFFMSPAYESTTTVMVMPRSESVASGAMVNPSQVYFGTHADVAVSRDVLRDTAESLGLDKADTPRSFLSSARDALVKAFMFLRFGGAAPSTPLESAIAALEQRTEAEVLEDSGIVGITVTWNDPKTAKVIADEVAKRYVEANRRLAGDDNAEMLEALSEGFNEREAALAKATEDLARFKQANHIAERYDPVGPTGIPVKVRAELSRLEARVSAAERDYEYWRDLFQQTAAEGITAGDRAAVLGEASLAVYPSGPDRLLYTAVGFFIGLLFGLGGATWMELSNRTVYTSEDVRGALGDVEVVTLPRSGDAEGRG